MQNGKLLGFCLKVAKFDCSGCNLILQDHVRIIEMHVIFFLMINYSFHGFFSV